MGERGFCKTKRGRKKRFAKSRAKVPRHKFQTTPLANAMPECLLECPLQITDKTPKGSAAGRHGDIGLAQSLNRPPPPSRACARQTPGEIEKGVRRNKRSHLRRSAGARKIFEMRAKKASAPPQFARTGRKIRKLENV
ncbi:MAG: hypothetical protein DBX55_08310 [Verrucomicrobia bacterium]|nr:MAG: hypothetical protein DBX55_08310 [Verrucomicrobiota bacterium]